MQDIPRRSRPRPCGATQQRCAGWARGTRPGGERLTCRPAVSIPAVGVSMPRPNTHNPQSRPARERVQSPRDARQRFGRVPARGRTCLRTAGRATAGRHEPHAARPFPTVANPHSQQSPRARAPPPPHRAPAAPVAAPAPGLKQRAGRRRRGARPRRRAPHGIAGPRMGWRPAAAAPRHSPPWGARALPPCSAASLQALGASAQRRRARPGQREGRPGARLRAPASEGGPHLRDRGGREGSRALKADGKEPRGEHGGAHFAEAIGEPRRRPPVLKPEVNEICPVVGWGFVR